MPEGLITGKWIDGRFHLTVQNNGLVQTVILTPDEVIKLMTGALTQTREVAYKLKVAGRV